jgi:hypothetical protein
MKAIASVDHPIVVKKILEHLEQQADATTSVLQLSAGAPATSIAETWGRRLRT